MLVRKTPHYGLGFTLRCVQALPSLEHDVQVALVIEGSEAFTKGVRAGSCLMEIDLQDVFGLSFEQTSEILLASGPVVEFAFSVLPEGVDEVSPMFAETQAAIVIQAMHRGRLARSHVAQVGCLPLPPPPPPPLLCAGQSVLHVVGTG